MTLQKNVSAKVKMLFPVAAAVLSTFALGLDMTIELPYNLIITLRDGFWGILDNLIISLNHFHTMDHLTAAVLVAGLIFVYRRWLYMPERWSKWGEYSLAVFFAGWMLISEMLAAENSIKAIWAGGTQILKAIIYLAGVYPLFLAGIRALHEGMQRLKQLPPLRQDGRWNRHPFLYPLAVMALFWLPYLLMKYPGGMSPDATVQILDWQYQTMELSHPPLTTVMYGLFYDLGVWLGNTNTGIFLFTLLQTFCFLAVLAYSCMKIQKWRVPKMLYAAVLAAYCIAPNYSGWTTTLVKDVPYLIACILLTVLLIDLSLDSQAFCRKWQNYALLIAAGCTVWLWRRNGIGMALGCGAYMLVMAWRMADWRAARNVAVSLAVTAALALGTNAALIAHFHYLPAAQREVYSHLLQVTGRVAIEHPEAYTEEEIAVIKEVMAYEKIPECYSPIITDGVKALFIENATVEEYMAFRKLTARKFREYPVEYADAYINLIYRLFDLRSDRGDYINRREISHPYYIRSYTNLLYEQQDLQGLNAAQEAVENWNFWFADLPGIGLLVNMGFCVDVMLVIWLIVVREKRICVAAALIPASLTALFCLFSPVIYIRYAVPLTATLPLWFVAYAAHGAQ